jgi:hypothetical protein
MTLRPQRALFRICLPVPQLHITGLDFLFPHLLSDVGPLGFKLRNFTNLINLKPTDLEQDPAMGSNEYGNEPSGFVKYREFLDHNYQFPKEDSATRKRLVTSVFREEVIKHRI